MDALIIAAGYGSRLSSLSPCKPLTPIAGVPLIELGIRQAKAAGAARVVVVTGHEAARLEAALADIAARVGIAVIAERLDDWSKPNGYSVMAGAARIAGDCLLLMADHIFAAPILTRLAKAGAPGRAATLAIDRRIDDPRIDPADATWVRTGAGERIIAIGKTIAPYDAVDCGAFMATPVLAKAIGAAIGAGRPGSLSDGMQYLADQGAAFAMDIDPIDQGGPGGWWLDVDDPRAHAIAEAEAPKYLRAIYS